MFFIDEHGRASHQVLARITDSIAACVGENVQYALEGSVFVGGAIIQWLRDELCIINNATETEEIANSVNDTNGVYIVPAFVGLGAPYWDANARGIITGITRGTNRKHIVRAALESIAYQVCDVVTAMEKDSGKQMDFIRVDGGASANGFLMQFQADLLGKTVSRPKVLETTALGACYLAGLAVGFWENLEDLKNHVTSSDEFLPNMDVKERENRRNGWQKAVNRAMI